LRYHLLYDQFLDQTGLRDLITLELNRKNMGKCAGGIWDTALRIRNLFLRMPLPTNLKEVIKAHCDHYFQTASVVVRSSQATKTLLAVHLQAFMSLT